MQIGKDYIGVDVGAAICREDGRFFLASDYTGLTDGTVEISQAQKIKKALVARGVPEAAILLEEKSTNTLENVAFSKQLLDEKGIWPASICYVSLNGHSGRCYLTLKKYFSDAKLTAWTYFYEGLEGIGPDNWMRDPKAIKKAYAEHQRILTYSQRGDIEKPNHD